MFMIASNFETSTVPLNANCLNDALGKGELHNAVAISPPPEGRNEKHGSFLSSGCRFAGGSLPALEALGSCPREIGKVKGLNATWTRATLQQRISKPSLHQRIAVPCAVWLLITKRVSGAG
jgi:hypothetical protein